MRKNTMKKTICLSAAACLLAGGLTVGRAMAYFTAYANTGGGVVMDMGFTAIVPDETVEEKEGGWTKHITVRNTGSYPCFVRVKLLYGSGLSDNISVTLGENWSAADAEGYYQYGSVVPAGGETTLLDAEISAPKDEPEDGMNFNVIVAAECTPVVYDENGDPYADWSNTDIMIQEAQGGNPDQPRETAAADEEVE